MTKTATDQGIPFPLPLVCPACRGPLNPADNHIRCTACDAVYPYVEGTPDLIVGERFPDDITDGELRHEDETIADTTHNYWIPMLRRHLVPGQSSPCVLSLGCGTGADIDLLSDEGFTAVGIDNGNRARFWKTRRRPDNFLLANGMQLPFDDNLFDAAYCGCVFPHVGVRGDSYEVTDHFQDDRRRLAREMVRVMKPGGIVMVASPNRMFPLDAFHGRAPGSYRPRPFNPFTDRFLLSVGDYRRMFRESGCSSTEAQPVHNYWGFLRSRKSLKGWLAGIPMRFLFALVSHPALKPLRGSPLNPWICVLARKAKA